METPWNFREEKRHLQEVKIDFTGEIIWGYVFKTGQDSEKHKGLPPRKSEFECECE